MNRVLITAALSAVLPMVAVADPSPASQPATAPAGDLASVQAAIKLDTEAIKSISDELARHEKDAADAEALAKSPPANIAEADKQAYIDQRKNDEQAAVDAATESRERLKEAQASLDQDKIHLKELQAKP